MGAKPNRHFRHSAHGIEKAIPDTIDQIKCSGKMTGKGRVELSLSAGRLFVDMPMRQLQDALNLHSYADKQLLIDRLLRIVKNEPIR